MVGDTNGQKFDKRMVRNDLTTGLSVLCMCLSSLRALRPRSFSCNMPSDYSLATANFSAADSRINLVFSWTDNIV